MKKQCSAHHLSAILVADMVDYSRLMDADEQHTVATLAGRRGVFLSYIPKFRGRVVDANGDALMADFGLVTDAVACAVEIQRALAERNEPLSEPRRMRFRIGINVGEVLAQGEEVYGDGVNLAARLVSLAEPGGICISRTAHDQALGKLCLQYEYLGEHTFKDHDHPIRVYRVLSVPDAAAHRVASAKRALMLSWLLFVRSGLTKLRYWTDQGEASSSAWRQREMDQHQVLIAIRARRSIRLTRQQGTKECLGSNLSESRNEVLPLPI
jgi:class 3 adenylate cyclase